MGRKKIYLTPDAEIEARRERQMRYHWKNAEERNRKCLDRYYKNKEDISVVTGSGYIPDEEHSSSFSNI